MGDSEIARLCRQIYQKHQRVIDLIYEHRPEPSAAIRNLLVRLIRDADGLLFKHSFKNLYVFFCPQAWEVPSLSIGNDRDGFFRFVFHNLPDELTLFLETSLGGEVTRRKLYEMALKHESLFESPVDPDTSKYPKLYHRTFLAPVFYEEATDSEREEEIRKHWTEFLEEDLPQIDAALRNERWMWPQYSETDSTIE